MLFIPDNSHLYRYIAIDPGSDTMGLSAMQINLLTKRLSVLNTMTVSGDKNSRGDVDFQTIHGNKITRLLSHQTFLFEQMVYWQPHSIICESAYMGKFAQAYGVLMETIAYLRQSAFNYNPYMPFEMVDPTTAKRNIKAAVQGKNGVREAILELVNKEFDYFGYPSIDLLDEHSLDSISIGYYKYKQMLAYM